MKLARERGWRSCLIVLGLVGLGVVAFLFGAF